MTLQETHQENYCREVDHIISPISTGSHRFSPARNETNVHEILLSGNKGRFGFVQFLDNHRAVLTIIVCHEDAGISESIWDHLSTDSDNLMTLQLPALKQMLIKIFTNLFSIFAPTYERLKLAT